MKTPVLTLALGLGGLFHPLAYGEACTRGSFAVQAAEPIVQRGVALINEIIRNPKAATTRNWMQLSNPHDETETAFFANSISDGSEGVYTAPGTQARIIRHTQSRTELAVVLQHLRLSLMAFNVRPGRTPPNITVSEIQLAEQQNAVVAKGRLSVYDATGRVVDFPTAVIFDVTTSPKEAREARFCLNLQSIVVGDQHIFGWWYGLPHKALAPLPDAAASPPSP